jgi:chromosome segregation ATPase
LVAELNAAKAEIAALESEKQSLVASQQRQSEINKDIQSALERSRNEVAQLKKDVETLTSDNKAIKAKADHTEISAKTAADTYSKDTAELKHKIEQLSKEAATARSKIAELTAQLATAQSSNATSAAEAELKKQLEAAQAEIVALKKQVEQLEKEKRAADITARRASRVINPNSLELRSPSDSHHAGPSAPTSAASPRSGSGSSSGACLLYVVPVLHRWSTRVDTCQRIFRTTRSWTNSIF